MGRWTTGAITTEEAVRIELSTLLKNGYIQKGKHITGQLSWTNGSIISFESIYSDEEAFIRLAYQSTDPETDEKTDFDYKIYLVKVPSNLGQGDVLYLLCPYTQRRCRILYKCYGSKQWKSRYAYHNRIYYPCQTCSKNGYYSDRYWTIEKRLSNIPLPVKTHYRGVPTRPHKRIMQLEEQLDYYDEMRWITLENELLRWLPEPSRI